MKSHVQNAASSESRPQSRYVGDGLVVRSHDVAQSSDLNENRNYMGRFNINVPAMVEALEEQGRCDAQLFRR